MTRTEMNVWESLDNTVHVLDTCSKCVYFRVTFRVVLLCGKSKIEFAFLFTSCIGGNENRAQKDQELFKLAAIYLTNKHNAFPSECWFHKRKISRAPSTSRTNCSHFIYPPFIRVLHALGPKEKQNGIAKNISDGVSALPSQRRFKKIQWN